MNVTEATVGTVATCASICEGRTLVRVQLSATRAFLAVALLTECLAIGSSWVQSDMRKLAVVLGAAALLEVLTVRSVVLRGLVGKRAILTIGAVAFEEPGLAD